MSRWFRTYGFGEVFDRLVIGAFPQDEEDVRAIAFLGVRRVLNLVENEEYERGARQAVEAAYLFEGIEEARLGIVDYGRLPVDALDEAVSTVNGWLDDGLTTYVHCRAGWQRSASVAAGVIATRTEMDIDDAVRLVRSRKPSANPLPHQREDLRRWWQARQRSVT